MSSSLASSSALISEQLQVDGWTSHGGIGGGIGGGDGGGQFSSSELSNLHGLAGGGGGGFVLGGGEGGGGGSGWQSS